MSPSPALLDRLSRQRLMPRRAAASTGIGERRSRHKGAGMEFADHRAYQPGDDLRHLDPHLYARFGEGFVRQYEVHRQLPVTIIVDASASMLLAEGLRYGFARELAGILGFVALAGSDQLRFAVAQDGGLEWSPRFQTLTRARLAFDWLARPRDGGGSFDGCLAAAARELDGRGLTIVLGDLWDLPENPAPLVRALGEEVWAIQVVTPEEADPALLGPGDTRLADPESGETLDLVIDAGMLERFRRSVAAWQAELRQTFEGGGGRFLVARTDTPVDTLVLQDWRIRGLIA